MMEHIAAQRSIEWSGSRDVIVGRQDGFDVAVTCDLCPGASSFDRTCLAIDGKDMTRRANGFRK